MPLGITSRKLTEDTYQIDNLQRPYGNHQRMESQTPGGEGNKNKGESSHYSSYCHRGSYESKSGLALRNQELTWRAPKNKGIKEYISSKKNKRVKTNMPKIKEKEANGQDNKRPKANEPTNLILNSLFQPARKNNGISKGYDHQYPLTGKEEKVQMTDLILSVFTLIR
ncbi:hypothetical protein O181_009927 [Austropuccinia psidii MF-1]|uniref:Uncharacterized protein n=1 Tax=Austropuccinia psidii MF-1 TaxID=1389203 RepID=A0A9Q3BRL9_9BASI|nr:hypothetical protein [Austropuccinia psidii MF-1]